MKTALGTREKSAWQTQCGRGWKKRNRAMGECHLPVVPGNRGICANWLVVTLEIGTRGRILLLIRWALSISWKRPCSGKVSPTPWQPNIMTAYLIRLLPRNSFYTRAPLFDEQAWAKAERMSIYSKPIRFCDAGSRALHLCLYVGLLFRCCD